jgi:D-3-phosphoglycerate dehydrogenase
LVTTGFDPGTGVATLTFNRPEALNAINVPLAEAFLAAVQELKALSGVRCVVLTGTGRAFMAGGDIASMAGSPDQAGRTISAILDAVNPAILLLRGIPEKNAKAHRGEWLKSAKDSYEIRGKKLGIVGYGNIGTQFSVLAEGLGMEVFFYDVVSKLSIGNATQVGSLQELLNLCDVVSLHVPETAATKYMFKAEQLAQMKPGSILMNASRGTVVDIDALADSLRSGKLLGAAVDVFPVEPKSNSEEFVSPLREFDNVILTPHVGGSTIEAQENIGREVAEKLSMYSDNGTSVSSVNFPEVALPSHPNQHRLLHIHENVPGVMSEINQVFSTNGINVCGQYLQTKEDIGYVVIDVDKAYGELALEKLLEVKGTIRCRVLF